VNFDFLQKYRGYSNVELLKIVKRPEGFQPAAVAAANHLLIERNVTLEEIQIADAFFSQTDANAKAKQEKKEAFVRKLADFFEPILHPGRKVEPRKWIHILLLVLVVKYFIAVVDIMRGVISSLQSYDRPFELIDLWPCVSLLYIALIFILLFKRKRWGWILIFFDNLFHAIMHLSGLYVFFEYQSIHHGTTISFFMPVFINGAFLVLLWQNPVIAYFGIDRATRKKTAVITVIGTILFILALSAPKLLA